MNTLFSASGYWIAMEICKGCVLESYETVKKFDNYNIQKLEENLTDFEIGPSASDDFVCQYITLKNSMSRVYLKLSRETSTQNSILISCSDRVRSRRSQGGSLPPNVRRSFSARLYVFHDSEQKFEIKARI